MIPDQRLRLPIMTRHEPSVSVSRDIDAPAHELFMHLARPADHSTIDGTGMLRGADDRQVLSGIGDVFEMKMFSEIGEYLIENHVVEFEPDRRIAWEPVLKAIENPDFQADIGRRAHVRWGWDFAPQPGGRTRVTEFYDLSLSPDWLHEATNEGEQWRPAMEASLANLARLVQPTD
ncbi:MAG: SRPBCC family protein [Acidimicrobiaceae bacterium]|nr:SRPBCC family protein [Acidimicrobiaceae bacterium]